MKIGSISSFLTFLIFAIINCTGPPAAYSYDPMCSFYEEHHGECCATCHDMVSCSTPNLFCVPTPISTTNSGDKPVVYDSIDSQVKGEEPYNGICEACHTQTRYHRNNASGDHSHCADKKCTTCHLHGPSTMVSAGICYTCHGGSAGDMPAGNPPMFATKGARSHQTHNNVARGPQFGDIGEAPGCTGCHQSASGGGAFLDGEPFATTTACDNCHSAGGAFDGVAMAKANWQNGIYEADGMTLRAGKEQWCAGCHDDQPAYSKGDFIEIVLDNQDATFVGSYWYSSTSSQQYGTNFGYRGAGDGTCTATWTPDIPQAGVYSVYAWWTDYSNRATNAPYTIYYDGGSETVTVNQKINGGAWNYLGTYSFAAGTSDSVVLTNAANGIVVADAIKLESGGPATHAPNVVGDNTNYGFYVTGHKIDCLSCHDAGKGHIDGDRRTYEADEDTHQAVNPYSNSYRLKDIDGQPAMNLPRASASSNPHSDSGDFALCFECHNRFEVLGETYSDVSNTNFWNDDSNIGNSHWIHLTLNSAHFDSDWDGTAESRESCITCHNVHGSPRGPMIRHGEMISLPGATNYVPALNFYYLVEGDGSATATFTPTLAGGTYDVYAWWSTHANRATNAKYLINHDGGQAEVIVNQEQNGGQWNLLGQYTITGASGSVVLTSQGANDHIMADAVRWYRTDGGDEVTVDDTDATYVGTWSESADNRYGISYREHAKAAGSDTATWTPNITTAGSYSVYAWWHADTDRASDAPYTIQCESGSATVNKDQRENGGQWNLLGTYAFAEGTSGFVKLTQSATGKVIADVVGWDSDGIFEDDWNNDGILDPEIVIDDPDAAYVGTWTTKTTERHKDSTRFYYAPIKDATASAEESFGGTFACSGSLGGNHVCQMCHSNVIWSRSQVYTGPRIPMTKTDHNEVSNYDSTQVLFTAYVIDAGDNVTSAEVDLSSVGGSFNQSMYDDGSHGDATAGDSIYSVQYTVPAGTSDGPRRLTITVTDADGQSGQGLIDFTVVQPGALIVDNPDATFAGTWTETSNGDQRYAGSYHYHAAGSGSNKATWTVSVTSEGDYNVYAWWVASTNRATNAPYTISYEGGSETVRVSQQVKGGQWGLLGTYHFGVGDYTVVLSDDANNYVIADAIKLAPSTGGPPECFAWPIADNPGTDVVGSWQASEGGNKYGTDFYYNSAGSGDDTATWTLAVPAAGSYGVYAWWSAGTNRATNAPYTINYDGGSKTVRVSQRIKDGQWSCLGAYPFNAGNYTVVLSDDADNLVIADAIKFVSGGCVPNAKFPIADNQDAEYVGPWISYDPDTDEYGVDFYCLPAGDGDNSATWTIAVPAAGTYNVYAWWSQGENRSPAAPYTINYQGGSETVEVNQQVHGGEWNYLGNYSFNAGNHTVVLKDVASGYVIADAIKFEAGNPPTPTYPYPVADNLDATFAGAWPASTYTDGGAPYGDNFQYHDQDAGASCTWNVAVPEAQAGNHNVYARWSEHSGRPANAPYTIAYEGGSKTVEVCQQIRGGQWNYLGNYPFGAGNYSVVLTTEPSGRTIADAVKFEKGSPPANPYPIADNWDGTQVGPWPGSTWADGGAFYGSDYQYFTTSGEGSNTFTWTIAVPSGGSYNVYARWSEYSNRAADVPYTIQHSGGATKVTVCQQIRGGQWNYLGNFAFDAGDYTVTVSDDTTYIPGENYIIADAIKFESGSPPANPHPIADNWDAVQTGPWRSSTWTGGGACNASDYQYKYGGNGSNTVTWTTDIPVAGTYNVYAWWSEYSNRATNAPYTIYHDSGSDLVTADQTTNGGQWVLLGSYYFTAGTYSVVLSDNVPGYQIVIADAIRWELQ